MKDPIAKCLEKTSGNLAPAGTNLFQEKLKEVTLTELE